MSAGHPQGLNLPSNTTRYQYVKYHSDNPHGHGQSYFVVTIPGMVAKWRKVKKKRTKRGQFFCCHLSVLLIGVHAFLLLSSSVIALTYCCFNVRLLASFLLSFSIFPHFPFACLGQDNSYGARCTSLPNIQG